MKLSVKKMSVAFGITWALFVLWIGWFAALTGWGDRIVTTLDSLYRGFHANFWGGLVGAVWGLADGLIFGALAAYIYNDVFNPKKGR